MGYRVIEYKQPQGEPKTLATSQTFEKKSQVNEYLDNIKNIYKERNYFIVGEIEKGSDLDIDKIKKVPKSKITAVYITDKVNIKYWVMVYNNA